MAFSMAILPTLSKHFGHGLENLRDKTELSIRYVIIFSLPTALGLLILADKIIFLIYGEKFTQSVFILQLVAPCLIPYSLVLILAQTLIAANFQSIDLKINMVTAVISATLNYVMIQYLAEIGAVIANFITIIVFLILQIVFITRILFRLNIMRLVGKPLLAALGMAVMTYAIREVSVVVDVLISTVVYFSLLFFLKGIYPEEIAAIKSVVKRSFNFRKP
jgi:O-antigen/teichoic acid export membrane protein